MKNTRIKTKLQTNRRSMLPNMTPFHATAVGKNKTLTFRPTFRRPATIKPKPQESAPKTHRFGSIERCPPIKDVDGSELDRLDRKELILRKLKRSQKTRPLNLLKNKANSSLFSKSRKGFIIFFQKKYYFDGRPRKTRRQKTVALGSESTSRRPQDQVLDRI